MLAELVDHVVGVDPDRDWITLAVLDARSAGVDCRGPIPGDQRRLRRCRSRSSTATASTANGPGSSKGSAGYGRGLAVALERHGEWVIEFDRPTRKTKDGAKSDALDAVRAAREMLGRKRLSIPRAHDGVREAIRVHAVTRAAAVRARTGAINELKAMIVTADESLRAQLRGLRTTGQVAACATFRDRRCAPSHERATRSAMRSSRSTDPAARRPRSTITTGRSRSCSTRQHRSCVAERGIGYVTAAAVLHRLVPPRPLPQRSRVRPPRRHFTGARNLRPEPDPPSPQPRRRPPTQPGALPRRRHQAAMRPNDQGLHRPARRRGQDRTRSHPMRQALPRPPRLATPRTPTDPHLTDIEASVVTDPWVGESGLAVVT